MARGNYRILLFLCRNHMAEWLVKSNFLVTLVDGHPGNSVIFFKLSSSVIVNTHQSTTVLC